MFFPVVMKSISLSVLPLLLLSAAAQQGGDAPLVVNREADSYAIAEQVYTQARHTADANARSSAMYRAAELFATYLKTYPRAANRDRALYLLAVCRAESGDAAASNATLETLVRSAKGEYAAAAAYKLGSQAAMRQDWAAARDYFRTARAQTKRAVLLNDALYRMARAQLQLGQRGEAEAAFRTLQTQPGVAPELRGAALLALAQMKTEDGNDAEAYTLFSELLSNDKLDASTRGTALLQAARLASKLGKSEEAQTYYARLNGMSGMEKYAAEAQLERLLALYNEKKYVEVVRVAAAGNISMDDAVKEARRDLIVGQSNMELRQYEAAEQWFSMAERVQPGTPTAADAGYRRLICVQQRSADDFFHLAEEYLATYAAPGSNTVGMPCIDLVRLMYADRMMTVDAAAAARQFEALRLDALPEAVRADAEFKKAWCAAAGEQYDPIPTLDHFLSTYPQDKRVAEALVLRGSAHAKHDNLTGALADFDRVVHEFPESDSAAVAWQRAAQACAKNARQDKGTRDKMVGYYEGLIKFYDAAVKRGVTPKPAAIAEAHYNIACALYDSDPAAAVPHFREARAQGGRYVSLVDVRLVHCFFKMEDAEGLRHALQTLEKTNLGSYNGLPPAILRWCGWMCYKSGKYAEADKFLSDALSREPRETYTAADGSQQERPKAEPIVWKTLARARMELQHYAEGLQAAEFYVGMENQAYRKAEGMSDQAQLLIGLNRGAEARAICEKAIAMGIDGPIKSALFITLGDACYADKQYSEAAKYYGRTANVVSDRELKPTALYKIAAALRRCGKAGEAEQYENTLRSEFPDWKPAPAVEALLNRP